MNRLDPKPPQSESVADANHLTKKTIFCVLDICKDKELFGKVFNLLHRSWSRSAQPDINADHGPVNVNAIVPDAPTRLAIAL